MYKSTFDCRAAWAGGFCDLSPEFLAKRRGLNPSLRPAVWRCLPGGEEVRQPVENWLEIGTLSFTDPWRED